MSECYGAYFIKNEEVLSKEEFNDKNINKGVSLYEVIRVIDKVPLFLDRHLERLNNSAALINKKIWINKAELKSKLYKLIKINNYSEGNIKIIFNNLGNDLVEKDNFYAFFIESHYPKEEDYKHGVDTVFCFMERSNPNAKIINKELREYSNKLIKENNVYEAILVDKQGDITEGSRSNIFMVKGDRLITAPLEDVLPGITRTIIIELCKAEGIRFSEKKVNYNDVKELDAAFISGTSPKILPIDKINDVKLSSSTNYIVQNIMSAYNISINNYINNNKQA
ncbi:aminotransferase class IV [Candidatus Clostridium stratigraminis]|uniref:Aminotransferase class IV n=1 Tax=Candidatus Clostridium stratigraminis TaxID=3381661 RepID=A0ABW8T6V9_9CLOT